MAKQESKAQPKGDEKGLTMYRSRDGQEIKLSFEIVRRFLVSGHPEFVTDAEIILYMGTCKARGLNPFKKDCYLLKYTKDDPAAVIVSIDYYRSRAKAQEDCQGWTAGVLIRRGNQVEEREGALVLEDEDVVGGWFRARPAGWQTDRYWTVTLSRYIKRTKEGKPTRFWGTKEDQADMIVKVVESQGLRRCWPDEFGKLYIKEEIVEGVPMGEIPEPSAERPMPKATEPKESEDEVVRGLLDWLDNEATYEELTARRNRVTEEFNKIKSNEGKVKITTRWNERKQEMAETRKTSEQ